MMKSTGPVRINWVNGPCLRGLCTACAAIWLLCAPPAPAAEPPPPDKGKVEAGGKFVPSQASGKADDPFAGLKIERLDGGKLRIGMVTLDQGARAIRFQAAVNMTQGPVEYALVAENGKVHESIFITKASPRDIHLAMLLLGVKAGQIRLGPDRALDLPAESAVEVRVEWETNGPPAVYPMAAMVSLALDRPDQDSGRTLDVGKWFYKGSTFNTAGFAATLEGSAISLIADESALVNNPGVDREQDEIHVPNSKLLPRQGMPVTIVISAPNPLKTP